MKHKNSNDEKKKVASLFRTRNTRERYVPSLGGGAEMINRRYTKLILKKIPSTLDIRRFRKKTVMKSLFLTLSDLKCIQNSILSF